MRPVLLPLLDLGDYLPYRRISFGQETVELAPAGATPRSFTGLVSINQTPIYRASGEAHRVAAEALARASQTPTQAAPAAEP